MNHKAAIHIIKGQLNLSDDDYRFHLREATGVPAGQDSCSTLNPLQLAKARTYFDAMLKRSGIVMTAKPSTPSKPTRPTPSKDKAPQVRRIRAQLISLGRLPDTYADGIAKQMFGSDAPQYYEWCHADQLHKISAALGAQQRRKGAPTR